MELITRNRLYKFAAFKEFGPFREIDLSRGNTSRERKTQENISSGHRTTNELRSTDDKQRMDNKRVKIFSKTFDFPIVKIHEPEPNMTTMDVYHKTTYNVSPNKNITVNANRGTMMPVATQPPSNVQNNNNYVQTRYNNHLSGGHN